MSYSPAHISSCDILAAISGPCSCGRDEAMRRLNDYDALQAQLAQAVEAKKSAVTMSEERLARALRAEDRLQLRAEISDDGELRAAVHHANTAEAQLGEVIERAEQAEAELEKYRTAHASSREELAKQHRLVRDALDRGDSAEQHAQSAEAKLKEETARADLATENLRLTREERGKLQEDLARAMERGDHYLAKAEKNFELRNEAEAVRLLARQECEALRADLARATERAAQAVAAVETKGWLNPDEAARLRSERDRAAGAHQDAVLSRLDDVREHLFNIGFRPGSHPLQSLDYVRNLLRGP